MENNEQFSFTYSAQQQKEIEEIRNKYIPQEEDKMAQLRKLHAVPAQRAKTASISIGVIGALSLGCGMSLIMTDLGESLGAYWNGHGIAMPLGIAIGVLGLVLVALAYPVYNRILRKERQRIAPQVLQLTDELLK